MLITILHPSEFLKTEMAPNIIVF